MTQVFVNLFSNAIKFSPPGSRIQVEISDSGASRWPPGASMQHVRSGSRHSGERAGHDFRPFQPKQCHEKERLRHWARPVDLPGAYRPARRDNLGGEPAGRRRGLQLRNSQGDAGAAQTALAIRLCLQPFDGLGWVAEDPLTQPSPPRREGALEYTPRAVQGSLLPVRTRLRDGKRCNHAKACLRGEGQDEGGLREAIERVWHHQSSESGSSVVLFTSEIAIEEFVNCTEAAWLRCLRKNAS